MLEEKIEYENAELRQLLRRVLDGDERAFDELFTRWRPWVRSLMRSFCRGEDLDDAVVEVFWTFYEEVLKHGNEALESPKAYLRRISITRGINKWKKERRERGRTEPVLSDQEFVVYDDHPKRLELRESLQLEFDKLPAQERQAVILVDVEGLTYEEAAEIMLAPLGSVKGWVHRGRTRLRQALRPAQDKK